MNLEWKHHVMNLEEADGREGFRGFYLNPQKYVEQRPWGYFRVLGLVFYQLILGV